MNTVRDHALKRPWLLAPPLIGMLVQNTLSLLPPGSAGAVMLKIFLSALMTVAVTAIFAELWIGDGKTVVPSRLVETGVLFIIPYPLLLVFGGVTAPFVYWVLRAEISQPVAMAALYLIVAVGKVAAFALGAVSSIAAARRRESEGALGALLLGVRVLASNARFFGLMLGGVYLFQEACVYLAGKLAPGMLAGFFSIGIPLLGCVALPVEAWRSGRLKNA